MQLTAWILVFLAFIHSGKNQQLAIVATDTSIKTFRNSLNTKNDKYSIAFWFSLYIFETLSFQTEDF